MYNSPEARQWFADWPELLEAAESHAQASVAIAERFSEEATRSSFAALAHRQDEMLQGVNRLLQRTSQFSPSKRSDLSASYPSPVIQRSLHPPSPPVAINPTQYPAHQFHTTAEPFLPSLRSSPLPLSSLPPVVSNVTPCISPARPPLPTVHPLTPPNLSGVVPYQPHRIKIRGTEYTVLPFSSLLTSRELILPPPAAFHKPATLPATSAQYPQFSSSFCSWNDILRAVQQPMLLWKTCGPGKLGDYTDIRGIWAAWDGGRYIEDVGFCAPLRSVEDFFGRTMDVSTNKGHYAGWRPSQDASVSD